MVTRRRHLYGGGILLAALCAFNTPGAFAGEITATVEEAADPATTLDDFVTTANALTGSKAVVVTINQNITGTTAKADGHGFWQLTGSDYANPAHTFKSVTLTGGNRTGSDRYVLSGDGTSKSSLMSIINVDKNITVDSLIFRGGKIEADTTGTYEPGDGVGLNIGGPGTDGANSKAPETIVVKNVLADANVYNVRSDSTPNAFGTGINVVGGTSAGGPFTLSSAVTFENVDLTNNSMKLEQIGNEGPPTNKPKDASIRGGGAFVTLVKSFAYNGGTIEGNKVTLVNGGYAAGAGLGMTGAVKVGFESVSLNDLTFNNNEVTKEGSVYVNYPNVARGGGFFYYAPRDGAAGKLSISKTSFEGNKAIGKDAGNLAIGGAGSIILANTEVTVDNAIFKSNSAETLAGAGAHAIGGALSIRVDDSTVLGADKPNTIKISQTSFESNSASAETYAQGGAVEISSGSGHTITGSAFKSNTAQAKANATGGGLFFNANTGSDNKIENSTFDGNVAKSTVNGDAFGGAIYHASGKLAIKGNGNSFLNNKATVDGTGSAYGGAIASTTADALTVDNELFQNNKATGTTGEGHGGAIYKNNGVLSLDNSKLLQNEAKGTVAMGGALDIAAPATTTDLTKNVFTENSVNGTTKAYGGAIAYAGLDDLVVIDSSFSNNSANAGSTGQALGGAIFSSNGNVSLTNTDVTGNKVSGPSQGSGIFMSTSGTAGTPVKLTLKSTSGTMTIDNGDATGRTGEAGAGIFFGAETGTSNNSATLDLDAAAGTTLKVLDNVGVNIGSNNYVQNRTGAGDVILGGANYTNINTGNSSTINFAGTGRTIFEDDYSQTFNGAQKAEVTVEENHRLVVSVPRKDENKAIFDYQNTGPKDFVIGDGVDDTANLSYSAAGSEGNRLVYSVDQNIVVTRGLEEDTTKYVQEHLKVTKDPNFNGTIGDLEVIQDGNEWILTNKVDHKSPFEYWYNSNSAIDAIDQYVNKWDGFDKDGDGTNKYLAMYHNPAAVTPEAYVDQGRVMLDAVDDVSRNAIRYGVSQPHRAALREGQNSVVASDDAVGMVCSYPETRGYRFWAGYVGNFQNRKSQSGFTGYKVDRHGVIGGINYDFAEAGSVGVYGGYTSADAKAKHYDGKVEQNIGHVGAVGRLSPVPQTMPGLSFLADVSYHFADNDMERKMSYGGNTYSAKGSFDQDVFSASVGAEYVMEYNCFNIVPQAELRYMHLDQDDLTETGLTATNAEGFNRSWLTQRIGAEASYDFQTANGVVTPLVGVAWRHDYGKKHMSTNASYIGPNEAVIFPVRSSKSTRDSVDVTAGIQSRHQFGTQRLGVDLKYNINVGSKNTVQSVYAGLNLGF